jgi:hypothetical protein
VIVIVIVIVMIVVMSVRHWLPVIAKVIFNFLRLAVARTFNISLKR